MIADKEKESPLVQLISFDKLLRYYDAMAKSEDTFLASKAKHILNAQAPYPELRAGFTDESLLKKHSSVIKVMLQDTFSDILGHNEIKVASLPFSDMLFNSSKRFQKIMENVGENGFVPQIRNLPDHEQYIVACTIILNFYHGFNLDFRRPLFYDIPDKNGVMRHYRILYNADFLELQATDKAKKITQADVDELMENFDNLELWKEKIPPNSYISKGFVISNMFDVTAEHSISEIKSGLIANDKRSNESFIEQLQETFKSLFNLPNIRVGFATYNAKENAFERVHSKGIDSYILFDKDASYCKKLLCDYSYDKLLTDNNYFSISDVDKYYNMSGGGEPYNNLKKQGIKSAIFAPIAHEGELLGVLELVSSVRQNLNSINANKLIDVMPFIVSAVLRSKKEEENLIDAVIQHECTSVHPSVYWRFQEEAKRFIIEDLEGKQPSFKRIAFKDVHPLYGQIDIKDSSKARNLAIQKDLTIQLSEINKILSAAWQKSKLPIYEELIFRVNSYLESIKDVLYTNSEQSIFDFVKDEIISVFEHLKKTDKDIKLSILSYEAMIDKDTQSYYNHRKNYDETVMLINKKLAAVIDAKQKEAQLMFPHYFERYKTDGVEHNMYIGDAIVNDQKFDALYLKNLRLWQLQVMCDMENAHYNLKPTMTVELDVASLILVHNTSLSIRFRMDEKRFDVDGTYNARYEIIKKRIDKSYIKGTKERLTQKGKLSIVYSQKKDELEYFRYIKFLKSKGYFTNKVEILELEDLQGVTGLKAIRAEILYKRNKTSKETYTYNDLMNELVK